MSRRVPLIEMTGKVENSFSPTEYDPLSVIVTTYPRVYLTPEKADLIKTALKDRIFSAPQDSSDLPAFRDTPTLKDGVLKIQCDDDFTMKWVNTAVLKLGSLFDEAALCSYSKSELLKPWPKLTKCTISARDFQGSVAKFRDVLFRQNRWCDVRMWYFYNCEILENSLGIVVTYLVPNEELTKVRAKDYRLNFGLSYIKLQVDNV